MKAKNPLTLSGQFESTEDFNSSFLKTKMKVFYFGNNRNGSAFNTDSFVNARKSLSMIPIVAKYNSDTDNLEGHNVELTVDENGGYKLHHDTVPFGAVSSDSNITFEEVDEGTETNPDIKTYVVIDNVYLWKRYDATKRIESWMAEGIVPKISMEIGNVEGAFSEDGYFQISNFEFEAITALGSDIEPCFPRAEIETYSKQSFKDEFKSMVYELSEALNLNQEGGKEEMEKENSVTPATPVTFTLDMFTEAQFAEVVEMNRLFDNPADSTDVTNVDSDNLESSDETFETTDEANSDSTTDDSQSTENNLEDEEEAVDETIADETTQEFALTAQQVGNQLRSVLGKEHFHDSWGSHCRKYWYADHTDTTVIFENCADNYQFYAANYTFDGDEATIQFDTAFKVKVEYVPFEGESVAFAANLERFEADKESTQTQLDELNTYKRQREESDIKAKFEGKLSNEELTQVFTELKDSELDKVEEKLFALIGKKDFSIQKPANTNVNKVVFSVREEEESKPYGGLFEKYQ